MNLFKRKQSTELMGQNKPAVIKVPDIKEYLVQEYEKVNDMRLKITELEDALEKANEIKIKYDAALVTLDEYSKRIKQADEILQKEKEKVERIRSEAAALRDNMNSYKIQFNNAAITKEEIKEEIVRETKDAIISKIESHKGPISKKILYEIINERSNGHEKRVTNKGNKGEPGREGTNAHIGADCHGAASEGL